MKSFLPIFISSFWTLHKPLGSNPDICIIQAWKVPKRKEWLSENKKDELKENI